MSQHQGESIVSTAKFAIGDRVIIDPDLARPPEQGVVWTVTRHLKVNVDIQRVDGAGRPIRTHPDNLRPAPADSDAVPRPTTSSAEVIPYEEPMAPGTLVTISGRRWHEPADILYTVLRDQGDKRVSCVRLGGDNGRYWRVSRSMLTVIDPAWVRLEPADPTP
jgi:hypothetical protein